mmetsp:Transcript_29556/g.73599  ORF Transcript_29556/g.73599 Transcript_29556/m.73599 type:complete len:213 (-) Transcript_29556:1079-1717(-)
MYRIVSCRVGWLVYSFDHHLGLRSGACRLSRMALTFCFICSRCLMSSRYLCSISNSIRHCASSSRIIFSRMASNLLFSRCSSQCCLWRSMMSLRVWMYCLPSSSCQRANCLSKAYISLHTFFRFSECSCLAQRKNSTYSFRSSSSRFWRSLKDSFTNLVISVRSFTRQFMISRSRSTSSSCFALFSSRSISHFMADSCARNSRISFLVSSNF